MNAEWQEGIPERTYSLCRDTMTTSSVASAAAPRRCADRGQGCVEARA